MYRIITLCVLLFFVSSLKAQEYTAASVFAHNDYVHPIPFYSSYFLQAGFIEADIFLKGDELLVAHTAPEIDEANTLESLYLNPVQKNIVKNSGYAYADKQQQLTLMIDIKTEGVSTLSLLVKKLNKYPKLISCPTLNIVISGNVPSPERWKEFPAFIGFDGRPNVNYTKEQLARVKMISTDFGSVSHWNGKGIPVQEDRDKIVALRDAVHSQGKKIRFWGAPDFTNAWSRLMEFNIDIIGTDDVQGLMTFIKNKKKNFYQNTTFHSVYKPTYNYTKKSGVPKNVILMIGDGMGLTQLYSGFTANRGALNIFQLNTIGFSVTNSADSYITDSAAGATAMATGKKTNNRFISVDSLGVPLISICEQVKKVGFRTAIISCGDITDATPASFYAHQPERSLSEAIANDFTSSNNDILIGSNTKAFENRSDGKNLFESLKQKGYTVSQDLKTMDTISNSRFVVIDNIAGASIANGRGDFLSKAVTKSLSSLTKDGKPFFMMTEGAQIDHGGHANDVTYVVQEMLDFDKAVGEAIKFIDSNSETLLIITADHETGGLSLIGGDISKGNVMGNFGTSDHTSVMVPVFSYGPGSDLFRGVFPNTAIHDKIAELLGLKIKQ